MNITINGEIYSFEQSVSVDEMLKRLACNNEKVAVERNLEIVPRSAYADTKLKNGDRLEIIGFIGGG